MKFKVTKTSGLYWSDEVEIDSLEALMTWVASQEAEVILKKPTEQKHWDFQTKEYLPSTFTEWELEIYNDMRE